MGVLFITVCFTEFSKMVHVLKSMCLLAKVLDMHVFFSLLGEIGIVHVCVESGVVIMLVFRFWVANYDYSVRKVKYLAIFMLLFLFSHVTISSSFSCSLVFAPPFTPIHSLELWFQRYSPITSATMEKSQILL